MFKRLFGSLGMFLLGRNDQRWLRVSQVSWSTKACWDLGVCKVLRRRLALPTQTCCAFGRCAKVLLLSMACQECFRSAFPCGNNPLALCPPKTFFQFSCKIRQKLLCSQPVGNSEAPHTPRDFQLCRHVKSWRLYQYQSVAIVYSVHICVCIYLFN